MGGQWTITTCFCCLQAETLKQKFMRAQRSPEKFIGRKQTNKKTLRTIERKGWTCRMGGPGAVAGEAGSVAVWLGEMPCAHSDPFSSPRL